MTKIIAVLFILGMAIQIIRPLGLPGLKKRGDFWKLAAAAFVITVITATIRP